MVYEIPLVEEKVKMQQVTALHLICALAFIGSGAIIVVYNYVITYWGLTLLLAGLSLILVTMAKNKWLTAPRNNTMVRIAELAIAVVVAVYSITQQWNLPIGIFSVLSLVVGFALYWERKLTKPKIVVIDDAGITLPSASRKRCIEWTSVEQVLLRFGTLSIDCTDNTLFQWNIRESAVTELAFEAFCLKQIEDNRGKRRTDEW